MRSMLYAAIGPHLTQYVLKEEEVTGAALEKRGTVTLPAGVQYAWRHASKPYLYVACSDGKPGYHGTRHFACVLRIAEDGSLSPHGETLTVASRPVHISTDRDSRHVLIAYHAPSGIGVHRIRDDGTIGDAVAQEPHEYGKTVHQVLATPENDRIVVPVRGSDAEHGKPEEPGSLDIFDYRNGVMRHRQAIAPDGGYGFGPRHVDFHPSKPWMYMSVERQNQVAMFEMDDTVKGPLHRTTTLAKPHDEKPRQLGGAIHVHPSGEFVYVSNRADGTVDHDGTPVFNGAENTIAVFAIDPRSGKPTRVQSEDTRGMHVRTFAVDATGKWLIAANMTTRKVLEAGKVKDVPGGLSLFSIGRDGRLTFIRKYDADVSGAFMFWMGLVARP